MRKFSKVPLLGLAVLAIAPASHADVAFHGYGQIVAGTVFSNNRTFPTESAGYKYHADPTFTPNSNFALQATAPLDNSISATAQILATGDNDFQPKFQWAYLKYQLNDTFALKAGRLQLPFYQYSDFQSVGEAYPWVLPPEAVYFSQAATYDGLNLSAEKSLGDWYLYMQAIYGSFDETSADPVATASGTVNTQVFIHSHNLTGFTLDGSYNDWLSLRAAVFAEKLTISGDGTKDSNGIPINPLDQLAALGSVLGGEAQKQLVASDDPNIYYVASAQITRNNWLLIAEYQGLQSIAGASGVSPQISSEYVTVGYHFGKLLPLATFGHRNQWFRADKVKEALTPSQAAIFDPIVGGLAGNPGFRDKDYFYEVGLRYDLTPTVALKLDYTFYESHYKTSDFPEAIQLAPTTTNPPDANRLLAAVTFSF